MRQLKALEIKAFTLVELIVVITILAILGTIAFISFQWYSRDSRDWARIADLNNIQKNLEIYITEKGTYPIPDISANISYSGWLAWIEWTVWDGVIRNIKNINKKPVDPLTGNEYTYSVTALKTEYQLWAISESWLIGAKLPVNQTYAANTKKATAMIRGTYNQRFLKVQSGWLNWILWMPTIITADIRETDLQWQLNNRLLVYGNYSNLPHSYNNLWFAMTGWFDYTNTNLLVYSWSMKSLLDDENKLVFIDNLKKAYNWTIIQWEPNYQDIVNTNTWTNQTGAINLINNFINTDLGWINPWSVILPIIKEQTVDISSEFTVSWNFWTNASWATITVCGTSIIATSTWTFTITKAYWDICNDVIAVRAWYNCTTTINWPSSLTSDITNIAWNCTDQYLSEVVLMMHMDWTNWSTTYVDEIWHTLINHWIASLSSTQKKFWNTSLYTNWSNWYIDISNDDLNLWNQPFTLEFWVYAESLSSAWYWAPVLSIWNGWNWAGWFALQNFYWNWSPYPKTFVLRNSYSNILGSQRGILPWQWYHIAIIRDTVNWNIKLAVDGTLSTYLSSTWDFSWTNYLRIWYYGWDRTQNRNIYIDELRLTKWVARYTADFTPPTEPF